jgi:hypothetical protein
VAPWLGADSENFGWYLREAAGVSARFSSARLRRSVLIAPLAKLAPRGSRLAPAYFVVPRRR